MSIIMGLIYQVMGLFDLLLLVYCVMSWIPMPSSQWMVMLRRLMDPILNPIRQVLARILPRSWQMIDLSPIAAWIILSLIRKVLGFLL